MRSYYPLLFANLKEYPNIKYLGESVSLERINELKELQYIIIIPNDFFESLEKFAKRNIVHSSKKLTRKSIKNGKVCLRCLKAFISNKSRELNISKEDVETLLLPFQCEFGHENYYLDQKRIINILN